MVRKSAVAHGNHAFGHGYACKVVAAERAARKTCVESVSADFGKACRLRQIYFGDGNATVERVRTDFGYGRGNFNAFEFGCKRAENTLRRRARGNRFYRGGDCQRKVAVADGRDTFLRQARKPVVGNFVTIRVGYFNDLGVLSRQCDFRHVKKQTECKTNGRRQCQKRYCELF